MMESYNLIKITEDTEARAEASNDISVTYKRAIVKVVKGGVSLKDATDALQNIKNELSWLESIESEKSAIRKKAKRSDVEYEWDIYAQKVLDSREPFLKNLYVTNSYYLWDEIEKRKDELKAEYLIIPGVYENLLK